MSDGSYPSLMCAQLDPVARKLHDPAMETAKVRDGQASAFEQKGYYHILSVAVKLYFQNNSCRLAGYSELTSSNIGRLNCFLRFSAVSIGI